MIMKKVTFRFTESEYEYLKMYVGFHDLNMTQAIKQGVELFYKSRKK